MRERPILAFMLHRATRKLSSDTNYWPTITLRCFSEKVRGTLRLFNIDGDFLPKNNAYACLLGAALKIIFPWKDQLLSEAFSEPCKTSNMEIFWKIVTPFCISSRSVSDSLPEEFLPWNLKNKMFCVNTSLVKNHRNRLATTPKGQG